MNHGRPPPNAHQRGQPPQHRSHHSGGGHRQQPHQGAPSHHQRGGGGPGRPPPPEQQQLQHPPPPKYHSYKVLIDPMIHEGCEKQVRYDGVTVPGNPHHMSPSCSDPRKKPIPSLWRRMEDLDLPVPRMIIDDAYVGEPPKVEVTMDNLNDNIDKQFLAEKLKKFGEWEELHIDYHPVTKKHLGLARIVFKQVKSAKECVATLHSKSMMGKLVNCYLDPRGLMAKKMFEDLTTEKKPSPIPPVEEEELDAELPELPETENVAMGGEYDDRLGTWDRDGDHRWDTWDGETDRGWPGEEEKGWDSSRRHKHWHDEDAQGAWSERGEYESRHHRSRWDDDRGDSRYGRRDRGRDERRGSRWDRDRNSRDLETDSRSRDSHRKYDGERDSRGWDRGEADWSQPQYWSEAPANYATNSYDQVEAPNSVDAHESVNQTGATNTDSEADKKNMDLDTRLQLLMKDKSGNMPAFLVNCDSSEEETPAPPPQPKPPPGPPPPLSRDPSPFLSHQAYMDSCQLTHQTEQLEKVNSALANIPISRVGAMSRQSDKMSLSPLSDGGMGEIEQPQPFPGQPGYWPGAPWPGGGYPGGWGGGYPHGGQSTGAMTHVDPYWQYTENNSGWGDGMAGQYNYVEEVKQSKAKKKYEGKDPYREIIDNVVHIVEKELKQILKKDINKRICETYAFLLYDNWWSEQEMRHKEKMEKEQAKTKQAPAPVIVPADREKVAELPRIPKPEDLTSLLDKHRANLGNRGAQGGSLGLGFRGKIPKVQRKLRTPSPESTDKDRRGDKGKHKDRKDKTSDRRDKSPRKKEKKKENDTSSKSEDTKASTPSVYKDIYGESEAESDKVASAESSEIESSETEESESSESDASESDSESESDKARSRSTSPSKSRSTSPRSKSTSPVPSVPVTPKPSTPRSRSLSSSSSSPTPSAPPTPTIPSPARPAISPRRSALAKIADSCTDSADDIDVVNEGTASKSSDPLAPGTPCSIPASVTTPSTPSTPVKVQHVVSSPPHIMDHCYARRSRHSSSDTESAAASDRCGQGDHDYTKPRTPPSAAVVPMVPEKENSDALVKPRGRKSKPSSRPTLPVKPVKFNPREHMESFQIIYKFLTDGIDSEDIMYLKRSYEMMLNEGLSQPNLAWINDTHWVDHPITNIPDPPPKKRRLDDFSVPHKSGSARTEGYYKMDPREKMRTKYHFHRTGVDAFNIAKLGTKDSQKAQKAISLSREARSQQRRMLNAFGEEFNDSELLKFNQLKFRRKAMKFGKSAIHDWGLFAMEHIGADEMVIEYVGDVVRPLLSDIREKRYEKQGIGSSYLFRIDLDYVVDATKCGNLARFINHSCEPNCYAKVIKIDGQNKIVIYSKQAIAIGEEITYDYKFPIEDEKIRCLCASKNCRKYLN